MSVVRMGGLFDRDGQSVIANPILQVVNPSVQLTPEQHAEFGYIPDTAQAAAQNPGHPLIRTPPWFSTAQLGHALWFSTRAILKPLGHVE